MRDLLKEAFSSWLLAQRFYPREVAGCQLPVASEKQKQTTKDTKQHKGMRRAVSSFGFQESRSLDCARDFASRLGRRENGSSFKGNCKSLPRISKSSFEFRVSSFKSKRKIFSLRIYAD